MKKMFTEESLIRILTGIDRKVVIGALSKIELYSEREAESIGRSFAESLPIPNWLFHLVANFFPTVLEWIEVALQIFVRKQFQLNFTQGIAEAIVMMEQEDLLVKKLSTIEDELLGISEPVDHDEGYVLTWEDIDDTVSSVKEYLDDKESEIDRTPDHDDLHEMIYLTRESFRMLRDRLRNLWNKQGK